MSRIYRTKQFPISPKKQTGVVLAIGLIMLLLVTLIGVTGMQTTSLEERMAGNYKDRNMAFQTAEATLRDAEKFLRDSSLLPTFNGTNGLYQPVGSGAEWWLSIDWSSTSESRQYSTSMAYVATQPRYIVEELPPVPDSTGSLEAGTTLVSKFYRVSANAVGGTNSAVVLLQSVYKR